MTELEELSEGYRTFAANAHLSTQADLKARRKLLSKTQKVIGAPPELAATCDRETEKAAH